MVHESTAPYNGHANGDTNGHHNGHVNGLHTDDPTPTYLHCESDYEPAPALDPAPEATPGWRSQFPQFTHHIAWVDSDETSHGLTIRTDSVHELFGI